MPKRSIPPHCTDKAIASLRAAVSGGKAEVTISAECANLLLTEIDVGREVFGTVVDSLNALKQKVRDLDRNHQSALEVIRKIRRGEL